MSYRVVIKVCLGDKEYLIQNFYEVIDEESVITWKCVT